MEISYILVSFITLTLLLSSILSTIVNVYCIVITLKSVENTLQLELHRAIRIASSVGNEELRTPEGEIINNRVLAAGGLITDLNESISAQSINRTMLPKIQIEHSLVGRFPYLRDWMEEWSHCSKCWWSAIRRANRRRIIWQTGIIEIVLYFSLLLDTYTICIVLLNFDLMKLRILIILLFIMQSYLTLGVAAGGVHEFQDFVTSSGYVKPWRNFDIKVRY